MQGLHNYLFTGYLILRHSFFDLYLSHHAQEACIECWDFTQVVVLAVSSINLS